MLSVVISLHRRECYACTHNVHNACSDTVHLLWHHTICHYIRPFAILDNRSLTVTVQLHDNSKCRPLVGAGMRDYVSATSRS